jgi:aerobic-type carbon monoxide dehydrogenase small subunit (CoxS/CutS family)
LNLSIFSGRWKELFLLFGIGRNPDKGGRMSTPADRSKEKVIRRGPGKTLITLRVNGQEHRIFVEPRRTLLDAIRKDLGLTGTKKGCDEGTCGVCTVLVDGKAVYSCMALAVEYEGKSIETIESLERAGSLHPIQQAFIQEDALQCGFCTPGQIMSVKALLDTHPSLQASEIKEALAGNLCRCGAYPKILQAVQAASKLQRQGGS